VSLIDALIPKDAIARAEEALKNAETHRVAMIRSLLPGVEAKLVDRVIRASSQVSSLRVSAIASRGTLGEVLNKVALSLESAQNSLLA